VAGPYALAFSPGQIGNLEIKNRLMNGPAIPNFSRRSGEITEREIDYYEEKAKGGFGAIFVSGTSVNDTTARSFTNQPGIQRDDLIPGWKKLAAAIHRHGAKCGVQIFHPGRQNHPKYCGPGAVPEAPSAIPCPLESQVPGYRVVEMTVERIGQVVEEYARAARRVREAGFDYVEVHGAHGYLPMQFLSPLTNVRQDQYGGTFAGRTCFIREVCAAIRREAGADFPLGMRFSADELIEGGLRVEDTLEYAKLLEELGCAYLNVSVGTYVPSGLYAMILGSYSPPGHLEAVAGAIREAVEAPILQYGGITSVAAAERLLQDGTADFVIMNRASIADPHIVRKTREGHEDDVRACIRCNNGCVDRLFAMRDITCTMNPELGREREFKEALERSPSRRKRVVVIGGGPAGMACAKYARLRGHEVTVFERESELGGLVRFSSQGPGRAEWDEVIRYYGREIRRLGVDVRFGADATVDLVRSLAPDAVVVATGSWFRCPAGIRGLRAHDGRLAANVAFLPEVMQGRAAVGERVVIVGGNHMGVQAARLLSEAGKDVTVVEAHPELNQDLDGFINWFGFLLPDLEHRGVRLLTHSFAVAVTSEGVFVESSGDLPPLFAVGPLQTVDTETMIPCDTVVVGTGRNSRSELFDALRGTVPELFVIGDAVKPRWTYNAIGEGATLGIAL
jgi:2,4-dienoyl-CoA reductase-like NADH-dependent reductase (Old Yellow Enzyme family)/thioredoxin reductase